MKTLLKHTFSILSVFILCQFLLLAGFDLSTGTETDPKTARPDTIRHDAENSGEKNNPPSRPQARPHVETVNAEIFYWEKQYEAVIRDIHFRKKGREAADGLYKGLNNLLKQNRVQLLKAIKSPPVESDGQEISDSGETAYQKWLSGIESDYRNMLARYDLRIRLIPEVTQTLRSRITGVDVTGIQELKGEFDHIQLRSRFRSLYAPLAVRRLIQDIKQAPLPAIARLVQFLVAVVLFSWWRKWARNGLKDLRIKIRDRHPKRRISLRAAWFLWYLERVRKPIEWMILLSVIFSFLDIPEAQDIDDIVWTNVLWVLITWFVILLINAMADRAATGLRSPFSTLRLRSFRLVAGWLLALMLGLGIAEDFTGKGTVYAWTGMLFKGLLLPVIFLLIHWWRREIFRQLEAEGIDQGWRKRLLSRQTGIVSYKNAAIGGVYLMIQHCRRQLLRGIGRFEGGRQLLATLASREALRTMESRRGLIQTDAISESVRQQFLSEKSGLVEDIFVNELERLLELQSEGKGGLAIVIAERGGGKSSLLKRLQMNADGKALILDCPSGGFPAFLSSLGSALDLSSDHITSADIEARLLDRRIQIIGIDNLHRLSKPMMGGQEGLDRVGALYREIGLNILWVIGFDSAAWQYIRRLRENRLNMDEQIELSRWSEDQIRKLVALRCHALGIKPDFSHLILPRQFDDIDHDSTEERNQAGYYRILWNAADGNPAVALRLWTESLGQTPAGDYIVSLPAMPSLRDLERVNLSVLLVLRVVTQSGMAAKTEIVESLRLPEAEVSNAILFAKKSQWVEEISGFYRITWQWFRPITRILARQNLLARKFVGEIK